MAFWSLCAVVAANQPIQAAEPPASAVEETSVRQERYLGVVTEPVAGALAAQFKEQLPGGRGLVVQRVLPDSPAAKAGIQPFDLLIKANDHSLASPEELKRIVMEGRQQTEVRLDFLREGMRRTVPVVPGLRTVSRLVHRYTDGTGLAAAEQRPAHRGKPAVENTEKPVPAFSVGVVTKDGERYQVEIRLLAEDKVVRLSGTSAELQAQMKSQPEPVQDSVLHQIERITEDRRTLKAVKFRFQTRSKSLQQVLMVTLRKPQPHGGMTSFELWQPMGEHQHAVALELLLDAPSFTNQLRDLDPAVREKIESTLKQAVLQPATVKMELSQ